jgi:hypothetical protein
MYTHRCKKDGRLPSLLYSNLEVLESHDWLHDFYVSWLHGYLFGWCC